MINRYSYSRQSTVRLSLYCLYVSIVCFASCASGTTDCFDNAGFDAFGPGLPERITAYHELKFADKQQEEKKPSMYIDFSSGLYEAYKSNANAELITNVFNKLSGNIAVFSLDSDRINAIDNPNSDIIGRRITTPNSYRGKYAPIKKAVEDIVAAGNDAILVTDFEEYYPPNTGRKEIIDVACFKDAFSKWLSMGNDLWFYVAGYTENGMNKHLYFTLFSHHDADRGSVLAKLNGSLKGLDSYHLTAAPYKLFTEYTAGKTGGCFYDNSGKDARSRNPLDLKQDTYVNGLQQNRHFEFYEFGIDWKMIAELKKDYQQQNQFRDFFRKLFINLSDEDAYRISGLEVKVYDVMDDYIHFAKCAEVRKHKPRMIKGSNGEDKIDEKDNDDIARSCYDADGKLKQEWVYNPGAGKGRELKEVFMLNRELFDNTRKNDKAHTEIGTVFHPDFDSNVPGSNMIRVDIVIKDVEPAPDNVKPGLFKWGSTTERGKENRALYESVTNAIGATDVQPVGKVIYSYYIKTL